MNQNCPNCGAKLNFDENEENISCPYCGTTSEVSKLLSQSDTVQIAKIHAKAEKEKRNDEYRYEKERESKKQSLKKAAAFSKRRTIFCIIAGIFTFLCLLMCAVAFNDGRILAGLLSILMIILNVATIVGGFLQNKKIRNLFFLPLILSFILTFPYFALYNAQKPDYSVPDKKIDWSALELSSNLPEPKSDMGNISFDTDDKLDVELSEVTKSDYNEYLDSCKEKGFTIDSESLSGLYEAYNSNGYKLRLSYFESQQKLSISLDAPEEYSEISWPEMGLAPLLPAPKSNIGRIAVDSSAQFTAYISDTDAESYKQYVEECISNGFDIDYSKDDKVFSAKNSNGISLILEYEGFNIMYISMYASDKQDETEISVPETSLSENLSNSEPAETEATAKIEETSVPAETSDTEQSDSPTAEGIRPEFKEAMDSYEKFFDEYCDFMKKYNADPTDLALLKEYGEYMKQYNETMQKMSELENSELNDAEVKYYAEVSGRITQKLLDVAS